MKATKKYGIIAANALKSAMEYRVNYLIGLLGTVFPIMMQCFIWTAIFKSSAEVSLYGYTYSELIFYSIVAGLTSKLVQTSVQNEMAGDIKGGGLNKFLVQPVQYFSYKFSAAMGKKAMHAVIIGIALAISLAVGSTFAKIKIGFLTILLYIPALLFGLILQHLLMFCVGTLTFRFHQISGFFATITLLVTVVSGGIFPLDVFGNTVKTILQFLPFSYIAYFEAGILCGRLTILEIGMGLGIQIGWIAVFLLLAKFLWQKGLKAYIAVGG